MPTRLKSLELQGYKTFASRTEFLFTGNITAIVGPNGSGKSNIADAIRWVLGEQTYSLLRGKRTEDMIFSGSEHRPRSGMASATITFDNNDGWLPIDFSEVAITRRAYRDGENEYLINGQRVRLKDILELLAQSGLAERTYTVIGQGLVDAALALKAEERRRLFEEAAGIGLHRSRREEALRRLENTRRNLERVEDILAELQPRLRSLERQARRAQEYEQIRADLLVLLRDWYGYHWHRAQRDLAAAQDTVRRQEKKLTAARQARVELDEQSAQLREQIRRAREKLETWQGELSELRSQKEGVNRLLAVGEERQKALDERLQSLLVESDRLDHELNLSRERLEHAKAQLDQKEIEYAEAVTQLEAAQHELDAHHEEFQQAEQTVQAVRQVLTENKTQQEQLSKLLHAGDIRREQLQEELERSERQLQDTEVKKVEAQVRFENAGKKLEIIRKEYQSLLEALNQRRSRSAELMEKRNQFLDRIKDLQSQIARLEAQLEVIEQAEQKQVGYPEGTRLLLQSARHSRLKARIKTFSSQIEVDEAYETAVEAALGEYIEGVLFTSVKEAEEAFDLLDQQSSRGVILPVQEIARSAGQPMSLPQLPGVIGWAVDLIRVPDELNQVAQCLLNKRLIVENRQTARYVLDSGELRHLAGLRIVTLNGDIFDLDGPMIIGSGKQRGLLSRPRQLREIHKKLSVLRMDLTEVEKDSELNSSELAGVAVEEAELRQLVYQKETALQEIEDELHREKLSMSRLIQELDWQNRRIIQLREEVKNIDAELKQLHAELTQLKEKQVVLEEELNKKQSWLSECSLEKFQYRHSHWVTQKAVRELAVEEARNRLRERELEFNRVSQTRTEIAGRVEQVKGDQDGLGKELYEAFLSKKDLDQKIEELFLQIQPAENELNRLEREQAELIRKESEIRQSLTQAESLYAQTRINLARQQEALESLRHRIEDDFGLVDFHYEETISGPTPLPLVGMVEQLPVLAEIPTELEENVKRQRALLRRIGPVNLEAQQEYLQVRDRYHFLKDQLADLRKAEEDLKQVIAELDVLMEQEFRKTFEAVAQEFRQVFTRLFGGGSARLVLTMPDEISQTGIDIEARLPGRREQGLSLLSGGERSLTAAALVFALLKVSPTPFCVLDEVDAMLDEVNVGRYKELLRELSETTQFVVITHNRSTVQVADVIYGVTMGHDSTSQVISLRLDEVNGLVT